MFDKIKFRIMNYDMNDMPNVISLKTEFTNVGSGEVSSQFTDGFSISQNGHLNYKGSFHKLFHGNNHCHYSLLEVEETISLLEQHLKVNREQIEIVNFEYGLNIDVSEHPSNYIDILGKSIKWNNFEYGSKDGFSAYYQKNKRSLIVYNKSKESLQFDSKIIRIECKVKNSKVFYGRVVTASDLVDPVIINALLDELLSDYHSIPKQSTFQLNINENSKLNWKELSKALIVCAREYVGMDVIANLVRRR